MDERIPFEILWPGNAAPDFTVALEQPSDCSFARKFSEWATELCDKVRQHPDLVSVNQALLQVVKKYFACRSEVPRSHRNHIGSTGHRCIYQVFVQAYESLMEVELSLLPILFLPPPPALPVPLPPVQIAGIFMGELDKQ